MCENGNMFVLCLLDENAVGFKYDIKKSLFHIEQAFIGLKD